METKVTRLNNGSKCLLISDKNSPAINIFVEFQAGARNEDLANNGIAHLIEHMMFKGSVKYPDPKKLVFEIENLGASINAWTSQELTAYYISGPKYNVPQMIGLLGDMLMNPIFPDREMSKEKKVIEEEIRMYDDDPQEKVAEEFLKALFPNHALGRNIAGSIESLQRLTADDCRFFINDHYSANNLLVIVAGDFNEQEILFYLNNDLGRWPIRKIKEDLDFKEGKLTNRRIKIIRDLEQAHLVIGGYGYDYNALSTKQRWSLNLGSVILGGGFGSMLVQKFREELALTYYIHFNHQEYRDTGYYYLAMGVNPKNLDKAIVEADELIESFISGGINDSDIERAKNYLIGNLITRIETSSDLAAFYAKQLMLYNKITTQKEIIKIIKDLEMNDILKLWKPLLSKNKIVAVLGNQK